MYQLDGGGVRDVEAFQLAKVEGDLASCWSQCIDADTKILVKYRDSDYCLSNIHICNFFNYHVNLDFFYL